MFCLKGWIYTVDWALLLLYACIKIGLFTGLLKNEIKVSGNLQTGYLVCQLKEGRAEKAGPTLAPAWGTVKDLLLSVLSRASDHRKYF